MKISSEDINYKISTWQTNKTVLRGYGKPYLTNVKIVHMKYIYSQELFIQSGREISAIIVTDDYLCYKVPESPYNFFLF